jgi:hypothetical protein
MKNSSTYFLSLSLILITLLSACEKFDHGGLRSKGEARLTAKTWELEKCELFSIDTAYHSLENNFENNFEIFGWNPTLNKYSETEDLTDEILIQDLQLSFFEEKIFQSNYSGNGTNVNEIGSWKSDNIKFWSEISTTGTNSIQLTDNLSFNLEHIWIDKLKNNKLILIIKPTPFNGCSCCSSRYTIAPCFSSCTNKSNDSSKHKAYKFYFKGT